MQQRPLGKSGLTINPIGLGCWPLAGITSGSVDRATAVRTIQAALDTGINHLDTAYAYGREGESERRIAEAISGRRDQVVLATKVGVCWTEEGAVIRDGSPEALKQCTDNSLARLGLDEVDLLYFHAPDENVPIEASAQAMRAILESGKARAIGVSNLSVEEMERFASECPFCVAQLQYNMLQRQIETDIVPWCQEHDVALIAYEALALGLLTGKMTTDTTFDESDWRSNSPLFSETNFPKNLATVEKVRQAADRLGVSVAQLVLYWTMHRPGITGVLCGAKRPEQIAETAQAASLSIDLSELAEL